MRKGIFGISMEMLATAAFVLCALNQSVLIMVLFLLVMIFEKDRWTCDAIAQALVLSLLHTAVNYILSIITFPFAIIPIFGLTVTLFMVIVKMLVAAVVICICIHAAIKTKNGRELSLPIISQLAKLITGALNIR